MLFVLYHAATRPDRFGIAVVVAPLFLLIAFVVARLVGRKEASFDLASIVLAGAAARVVGAVLRDSNAADGNVYYEIGRTLSDSFRAFQFDVDTGREFPGTGFLRYLSGLVQVLTFNDRFTTFVTFTLFSFTGAVLFYLAFARALPDGNRRRYAVLVFLWPSMAYWPSSLGKEAWMVLSIGIASYGAARVLTSSTLPGYAFGALGIMGASLVRPHVSVIVMAATAVAVLIRKPARITKFIGGRRAVRTVGTGAKAIAVVLVLVGGGYLATQTQKVLKLDESTGGDAIGAGLSSTEEQTTQGSSAFTPFTVRNPANFPAAAVTVVFRPFPVEARGVESFLSAGEGVILLGLFAFSIPRLIHLPRLMRREAYVTYALTLTLVFIYAFSAIGNFGILARQRTQVLPLVFVLVCLPMARAKIAPEPRITAEQPEAEDEVGGARSRGSAFRNGGPPGSSAVRGHPVPPSAGPS
jgi:hypothetical protein